jgi:hypothetical protein
VRVPIPDDWDGKNWQCYRVEWPASNQFRALLEGFLSYLMRGRYWDERTGSVSAAQAIGWQVFSRNVPLTKCSDVSALPGAGFGALVGTYEGEDLMPCIDISNLLKIEDGVLYARDSCCEWIAIGPTSGGGVVESVGDTPLDLTGGEDPPTYAACGKATAVVNFAYDLLVAAWLEADELPWKWVGHLESALGQNMSDKWLVSLVLDLDLLRGLGYTLDDLNDPWVKQNMICKVVNVLNDGSPDGATQDQYEQIRSIFLNDNLVTRLVWGDVFNAMGWKLTNRVAMLGATDTTSECDCPDVGYLIEYGPDGAGWYLSSPFAGGMQTNSRADAGSLAVCFGEELAQDAYGVAMRLQWTGFDDAFAIKSMGSSYAPDCADVTLWESNDSSEHLENVPQNTWLGFAYNSAMLTIIQALVLAQSQPWGLGYAHTFWSNNIAVPGDGAAGGVVGGVRTMHTLASGGSFTIAEVRWLHNTNSPSHG